jgi:hypothetical protein
LLYAKATRERGTVETTSGPNVERTARHDLPPSFVTKSLARQCEPSRHEPQSVLDARPLCASQKAMDVYSRRRSGDPAPAVTPGTRNAASSTAARTVTTV